MQAESIKKKVYSGTAWTILGYGLSQGLRLGSNLILTRLLVPEAFGLMALAYVFITGLSLFSDIGITPSIVRHEKGDDPDFLNTAWTIQVIRGFCLFLGCLVVAWPASKVYDEPLLLQVIPLLGFTVLLQGFQSTSIATLSRHMKVGKATLFQIGSQLIGLAILIPLAFWLRSVWALVLGNLISQFISTLASHFLIKNYSNRLAWEKEALNELITFGRWILLSTAFFFLAEQSDRILLGKIFTVKILGIYTIAITFAEIQKMIIGRLNGSVLLPAYSKALAKDPKHTVRQKVLIKRRFLLLAFITLITFLFNFGDILIYKLYDERYYDAAWMLPILAVGVWPLVLHSSVSMILITTGKAFYNAAGNLGKLLYMILLIPFISSTFGLVGAIVVIAFNDIPSYSIIQYGLFKEKFSVIHQDLWATLILFVSLTLVMYIRFQLGFGFSLSRILEL